MNFDNEEESLELINRLLERLKQADYPSPGNIVLNIYKQGSQHVDKVENQYIGANTTSFSTMESCKLPDVLSTEKAMELWHKVQQAGYVDNNYQPLISRTQAALMADAMAEQLGIREKWKVFGGLWNRTKMYKDYYQAVEQKQFLPFMNKLKQIL